MNNKDHFDDTNITYYAITEIDDYCQLARTSVAQSFDESISDKELDSYISLGQVEKIVDEFCDSHNAEGCPIVCEETHSDILDEIGLMIHNVALAKMASNNLLQVAFDENLNDFVFWVD